MITRGREDCRQGREYKGKKNFLASTAREFCTVWKAIFVGMRIEYLNHPPNSLPVCDHLWIHLSSFLNYTLQMWKRVALQNCRTGTGHVRWNKPGALCYSRQVMGRFSLSCWYIRVSFHDEERQALKSAVWIMAWQKSRTVLWCEGSSLWFHRIFPTEDAGRVGNMDSHSGQYRF